MEAELLKLVTALKLECERVVRKQGL